MSTILQYCSQSRPIAISIAMLFVSNGTPPVEARRPVTSLFTVSNSDLFFYTKLVSTTPSHPRPLPSPTPLAVLIVV